MSSWEDYKKTMVLQETLWSAAKANDVSALSQLLGSKGEINQKDHRGYSPLMLAVYSGNIEATKYLLANGADPNSFDFGRNTVLMGAAFKGQVDLAALLIEAGAGVGARNTAGLSAADFAVTFGRSEMVQFLKNAGSPGATTNRALGFLKLILQPILGRMFRTRLPKV